MGNDEKRLSDYIDSLNEEKKPEAHGNSTESTEMEELMKTVRKIRNLKEPTIPGPDYPGKMTENVAKQLSTKPIVKKKKWTWIAATAAVAAVVALVLTLNSVLYPGNTDIVYAMEQAFQEVKAYHGIIEIVEKNAEGKETTQAIREVWADKEGNYYVKELEGSQMGLITANNGEKKWQQRPDEKQVFIFPAFPDPYQFTFELGNEIDDVKNASEVKAAGEDSVSNRAVTILEVTPKGGQQYRIWVDKETKLPLKRESAMQNSIQYTVTYTSIDYCDALPEELVAYSIPEGFEEIDKNPEQLVNNIEEVEGITGFAPRRPKGIPEGYRRDSIAVANGMKTVKFNYTSQDRLNRVIVLQGKAEGELNPASTAVLGTVNGYVAEIQSPVQGDYGILAGGGVYSGVTDISSIRWQEGGFEFAVVGNVSLGNLASFAESLTDGSVVIPTGDGKSTDKPQVEVPVDLEIEENEQKSADAGHSPWKLDPAYVAQVFISLKISPEGIQGDYPVQYEDIKVIKNDGVDAVMEVSADTTTVRKVYLKRLIRQDNTGIWTVVGYDPISSQEDANGLQQSGTQVVAAYFIRTDGNPGELYPVYREVSGRVDPIEASLEELLKGPSEEEYLAGYRSLFSEQTGGMLRGVNYNTTDGTLTIDFNDFRNAFTENSIPSPKSFGAGGIMSDITWTIFRQFPDVQALRFAFEGDEQAFWSWLAGQPQEAEIFTRTDWEEI